MKRFRRRSGERGAALVEASVVLPVLLGFLAVMTMIRAVYIEKIDGATKTRSDVLSFAGNGCEGKFGTALKIPTTSGLLPGGTALQEKNAKNAASGSGATREVTSGVLQKAMAKIDARHVSTKTGPKWTATVGSHASFLLCNEKAHGSGIGGLASWITKTIASVIGL